MPRRYPPEFRHRVLDLIASGRKVADVARDLGVSDQTIYNWRNQDLVDRGERPGLRSSELAELQAARHRIAELEAELAATKRANELLKVAVPPKGRFATIAQMAEEDTRSRSPAAFWRSPSPGSTPSGPGHPHPARSATPG